MEKRDPIKRLSAGLINKGLLKKEFEDMTNKIKENIDFRHKQLGIRYKMKKILINIYMQNENFKYERSKKNYSNAILSAFDYLLTYHKVFLY